MNNETSSEQVTWLVILLFPLVLVLLSSCSDRREPPPPPPAESESEPAEIRTYDYSGDLRIRSTDGLYIHDVIVKDAEGEVIATGDTGNPFAVPKGTFDVHVQGYVFPITVERDKTTTVSVQQEVGLGKLIMPAADRSYLHQIVVTDLNGNEVATGRSGFAIDLPPGTYLATMKDRTVEVEIRIGETTRIDP